MHLIKALQNIWRKIIQLKETIDKSANLDGGFNTLLQLLIEKLEKNSKKVIENSNNYICNTADYSWLNFKKCT